MAHWKSGFPGKYMQVSDLDTPKIGTIAGVKMETVGSGESAESKLVVRFKEPAIKPVVLNLTRAEAIEHIVGDADMDRWAGKEIMLTKGSTRYQGKRVACIAVEKPTKDDIDESFVTLSETEAI